jgi:hypothetical protein
MRPKKEADLEAVFRALCRQQKCLVEKVAPTRRGMPDRIVLAPGGRIYLVELKREGEKPTPIQEEWHKRAWIRGTKVVVLHGEAEIRQWCGNVGRPEGNQP